MMITWWRRRRRNFRWWIVCDVWCGVHEQVMAIVDLLKLHEGAPLCVGVRFDIWVIVIIVSEFSMWDSCY